MSIAEQPAVEYANDDDVIGDIATPAERTLLAEFRAGITPHFATYLTAEEHKYNELTGDLRLLRFLRGYKGVVKDCVAVCARRAPACCRGRVSGSPSETDGGVGGTSR